jgi:hypothetical protein
MNVRRIVNQFLLSTDERKKLAGLPPTFDSITADQACNEKLYEEFAFYLANQYKCGAGKNKGEHLKVGPAVNYLNSLAKQLSDKHKHVNDTTKFFFTCKDVNGSSDPWVWFNGVRSNMHGIIYERAAKRGEEIDASAPAIYPTHVDKISEALMKEGSDHSAIVNITQLTTLYSGSRPCEPENLALRGMQDDDEFNVTKGPLPQIKTKKTKVYSIPAAAHRHRSWHLAWGDFLVLVLRQAVECERDEFGDLVPDAHWLIPELQQVDNPGTWLGIQLKHLKEGSHRQTSENCLCACTRARPVSDHVDVLCRYKDFSVPSLPDRIAARTQHYSVHAATAQCTCIPACALRKRSGTREVEVLRCFRAQCLPSLSKSLTSVRWSKETAHKISFPPCIPSAGEQQSTSHAPFSYPNPAGPVRAAAL